MLILHSESHLYYAKCFWLRARHLWKIGNVFGEKCTHLWPNSLWNILHWNTACESLKALITSRLVNVPGIRDRYQMRCLSGHEHQTSSWCYTLHWRHDERNVVLNHQLNECLFNRLFRRRSMKNSKLRAAGLCAGNSPLTGEFLAQRASNAGKVSIWCRHHVRWWVCSQVPSVNGGKNCNIGK